MLIFTHLLTDHISKVWKSCQLFCVSPEEFTSYDFHIIQFSGTDVGFFITSSTSDTLKVNQIYILPEYQGRGIGSACLARIIDNANLEQRSVVLQVLKVNIRGITLYQRLGFTIVGEDSIYFQMEKLPELS